jgi:hypothetical protein
VFAGSVGSEKVAVKVFSTEMKDVISEAKMMSSVPVHPNVVTL